MSTTLVERAPEPVLTDADEPLWIHCYESTGDHRFAVCGVPNPRNHDCPRISWSISPIPAKCPRCGRLICPACRQIGTIYLNTGIWA